MHSSPPGGSRMFETTLPNPQYPGEAPYVLPTGEKMNPAFPRDAEYYAPENDQTAYVLFREDDSRTRPTRVVTGFGGFDSSWGIGARYNVYHDQNGRFLGLYRVVGVHD